MCKCLDELKEEIETLRDEIGFLKEVAAVVVERNRDSVLWERHLAGDAAINLSGYLDDLTAVELRKIASGR